MNRGGPGIGDPLERDPAAVARDVNNEHIFERFASSLYGVVLIKSDDGKFSADKAATEAKRAEMRKTRLARSQDAKDFFAQQKKRVEARSFIPAVAEMYRSSMSLSKKWAAKYRSFWGLSEDWAF